MDASLPQTRRRSVLRGAAWPQERKTEMRDWVHGLQIYNHSSCDPCVTSSPWHLLRTQQLPGTEVQPCPPPPEDDLLKLSTCSLAPRMVASEAVGIFGWTVRRLEVLDCNTCSANRPSRSCLTLNSCLGLCNPRIVSARDEGVRVQLQDELDPRNGLCFCFPICNQSWHPAQNLCSIYSGEVIEKGAHQHFPPVPWMLLQEIPQKDPGLLQETTSREGVWSHRDDRIWTCSSAQLPSWAAGIGQTLGLFTHKEEHNFYLTSFRYRF